MGYEANGPEEYFTSPGVQNELIRDTLPYIRLKNAISTGKISQVVPNDKFLEKINQETVFLREASALTVTDKELLALGLQLKSMGFEVVMLSDDYGVQNVAESLELNYRGLSTWGIKRKIKWDIYCPGCKRTYATPQEDNVCPICGTSLKRKPKSKRAVKGRIK